jgi:uncharacterized protein involved in type VI secretion and phage assembly
VHRVVQTIRQIARHEVEQRGSVALGVVRSLHGAGGGEQSHACTVELRESGLVLPRVPIAVGLMGFAALPREGDLVVVTFAGGDLHAPVVVGRLYSDAVAPPDHGPDEAVLSLPGGEAQDAKRLELRVTTPGDGTRAIALVLDGNVRVEVRIDDQGVQLKAQDATFTLQQTGASDGRAELKVGDSRIVVEQGGDVTVEAQGTLTLKGSKVEISGDTSVKVAGQTIDLN